MSIAVFFAIIGAVLIAVAVYDVLQRQHAILRAFPIVGHFRYLLEEVGPELRQYIITSNTEEKPFSRYQRRWIYASSKRQNNYFGFGTDQDVDASPNYLIIKHATFPERAPRIGDPDFDPAYRVPAAKVLGAARARAQAFRPSSVVNVSGMSFGALSGNAIAALNDGAAIARCLHNTGEGGVSPNHQRGGELIWQLGSGYFGARTPDGRFDLDQLVATVAEHPVRAIEIKLSQGAKPGIGGTLPAAKVTPLIARARGVPAGVDCVSPSRHSEFHDVDSMLDFVERLADATGLPVGIKSAVGDGVFWVELAERMAREPRGVDFITVDGGEGGTGAAPLVFADKVALPFKLGFTRVYREFAARGIEDRVLFIGSGKLGFPESALLGFALGCDMVNVGREAMMAIGCIQAQRCHTGRCPTGVATQNWWLTRGLDPATKSRRLANYVIALRHELLALSHACGAAHPGLLTADQIEILDGRLGSTLAREVFHYEPGWGLPSPADRDEIVRLMADAHPESSAGSG